jgi:hypothetical protein
MVWIAMRMCHGLDEHDHGSRRIRYQRHLETIAKMAKSFFSPLQSPEILARNVDLRQVAAVYISGYFERTVRRPSK